jgi:hypothetical protein
MIYLEIRRFKQKFRHPENNSKCTYKGIVENTSSAFRSKRQKVSIFHSVYYLQLHCLESQIFNILDTISPAGSTNKIFTYVYS